MTTWYEFCLPTEIKNIEIITSGLGVVKIDSFNFEHFKIKIQQSITNLNSEINWPDSWNITEAEQRLNTNHILYLFFKNNQPIGHVWYIGEYLYNAFVSNTRNEGESQWFIQQTMKDVFSNGYSTITLYTENWNKRAMQFWEKLGYTIINKTNLIEYGRESIHETQGND